MKTGARLLVLLCLLLGPAFSDSGDYRAQSAVSSQREQAAWKHFKRSESLLKEAKIGEALRAAQDAEAAHPQNGLFAAHVGNIYRNHLKQHAEALQAYARARHNGFEADWLFLSEALSMRDLNRYEEALTALQQCDRKYPAYGWCRANQPFTYVLAVDYYEKRAQVALVRKWMFLADAALDSSRSYADWNQLLVHAALRALQFTKDRAAYDALERKWLRQFAAEPRVYEALGFALVQLATGNRSELSGEVIQRVIKIRRQGMLIHERDHPDRPHVRNIGFPLRGRVQIWTQFDDEVWSHVGLQGKYCYDMGNIGDAGPLLPGHSGKANKDFVTFGQPLYAVLDGVVKSATDETPDQPPGSLNGGGNQLWIEHADGHKSYYDHLKFRSLKVKAGDAVKRGQIVAAVGNTGASSQPHLHFCMFDREDISLNFTFEKLEVLRKDGTRFSAGGPYLRGWIIRAPE